MEKEVRRLTLTEMVIDIPGRRLKTTRGDGYASYDRVLRGLSGSIVVRKIPDKGLGVFAARGIKANEIIDRNRVVIFPEREYLYMLKKNYILSNITGFEWEDLPGKPSTGDATVKTRAAVMGPIAFCNHSYTPNSQYLRDYENEEMALIALRDIDAGEEITFNYNGNPWDNAKIKYFNVK